MNTAVEVYPVTSENRNPNQRDQSDAAGGTKQTQNGNQWGKTPNCINCSELPPVQHVPRQVSVQLQQAYKEELDQLKKWGILCIVHNEFTPWGNSTVVTIKLNGSTLETITRLLSAIPTM